MKTAEVPGVETLSRHRPYMIAPSESWIALFFLWAVYAIDANSRQMIYYVLPAITKEFSLTPSQSGLYTTIVTVSTSLLAVPAMLWANKGGHGWRRKYRHLLLVIGYTLFTFLTGFNVITGTIGLLVLLQVLSHMFGGVAEVIEVTSAAEWWSKERRGLALGIHHTGFPWGTLIGGMLVSAILSHYGSGNWRMAFLFFPIPIIIFFAAYWFYATERRYDSLISKIARAGETHPVAPLEDSYQGTPTDKPLAACLSNPNIAIITLVSVFAIIGYWGISFWLPQYLAFVAHYNFAQAAAYSVLFTITGGLGQIFWGSASDRIGRKLTLVIVFAWIAVGMWLFQFAGQSLLALVAIQLVVGFAMNAPYTLIFAIAFDSAKAGTSGLAAGLINAGLYVGGIGPYILGALISAGGGFAKVAGYNTGLYFLAFLMVLGTILTALFTRETTGWFVKYDRALVSRRSCNLQ